MVVVRIVEGGVASKTNQIRAGDIISHIEGLPTVGWPLEKVKASMQGPEGTSVKIGASTLMKLRFRVSLVECDDDVGFSLAKAGGSRERDRERQRERMLGTILR